MSLFVSIWLVFTVQNILYCEYLTHICVLLEFQTLFKPSPPVCVQFCLVKRADASEKVLAVSWHRALKLMSFKNRCGNLHMRRQEPWQRFWWAYLSITLKTPHPAPQRRPFISNVKHHWYNFGSLIYGRCLANRYFIQSSQTANHPPPALRARP